MPDIDNRKFDQDALLEQLGIKNDWPLRNNAEYGDTSHAMSVDPRPQSDVDKQFADGTAAGQDMSWMTQPGSVTAGGGKAFTPQVFQGFTPKYAMEGFDFNREQNTGKSAKDAFAYLSQQAPPPPLNDKAALGQWFNQYIAPGMKELGHDVSNVNGDTFHLKNWQGDFDVDYGRGAGADNGALAWQVQEPTAKLSNGSYTPKEAQPLPDFGGNRAPSAIDRILEEVNALQSGAASPMDQQALEEMLRI